MRIISLIASATEIICELGLRRQLVGRSHECDYPSNVRELPVLSNPKVNPSAPSDVIDRDVRALVQQGLSVYNVRVDELERLAPDLIVTQDHCQVCAVSLDDVRDALYAITKTDAMICTLHPETLDDVRRDFQRVADAAGVPARGRALRQRFDRALDTVQSTRPNHTPRVALIEWLDPPMIAGGWMPELARIAGAEPVIVTEATQFATVTWDDIVHADPDIVVIMPCGYENKQTLRELRDPGLTERVRRIPATRRGQCFVVDGNAYFNRPGPRLADSTEILAGLVAGDLRKLTERFGKAIACWDNDSRLQIND